MMFSDLIQKYSREMEEADIMAKSHLDVEVAIGKDKRNLNDFKALVSPAAAPYLEEIANISQRLTQKRFGKTIQLYLPLYLSNYCDNSCIYCGFNCKNDIERKVLTEEEIIREAKAIKDFGYEHILLVTGESVRHAGFDYLKRAIELIKPYFSLISIEVQPLESGEYTELKKIGLNTVYIYQETYHKVRYAKYHPAGRKSDFDYRIQTADRIGEAGVHKIGLGFLIGLENWRTEAFFTALHLKYLEKNYWRSRYSISFPRLRKHAGNMSPNVEISDRELVQLICAYRLLDEEVELSMSVRESIEFRDNIVGLGITSMSAGSRTEPGGYTGKAKALEQFEVHDNRSPAEVAEMIRSKGYEAVWKDWDSGLQ